MTRQSAAEAAGGLFGPPPNTHPPSDAPTVLLLDGRRVSSWSQDWLIETRDREIEARAILALREKSDRTARLALYEFNATRHARHALPGLDPVAYTAEARLRLEECVRACWRRSRAAAAALLGEEVAP